MKTLLIEAVTNGWIVRPFSPCRDWVVAADRPEIAVFTRMIDLQTALPDLLADEKLVRPPQQVTPGGDRLPETIGNSELTPSA